MEQPSFHSLTNHINTLTYSPLSFSRPSYLFLKIDFIFYSFRFTEKQSWTYREYSYSTQPPMHKKLSLLSIHHHTGTFVTPITLTHHNHPKSIVYIRGTLWVLYFHSVSFEKCIVTYRYHYRIIESNFTALRIHCSPPIYPFLPANPWKSPVFWLSP